MVKTNKSFLKLFLTVTAIFIAVTVAVYLFGGNKPTNAYAAEKNFSATQKSQIVYCGANYFTEETLKDKFLDAFSFKIDGEEIIPIYENITIKSDSEEAIKPGKNYKCSFDYTIGEETISSDTVLFTISKAKVTVTALLNGLNNLTIDESEVAKIYVYYDYACDVASDVITETKNGVTFRTLSDSVLDNPAWIDNPPTDPVQNYKIVPGHAMSDYYDFIYATSILNVVRTIIPELTYVSETGAETLAAITGSFSSAYTFSFVDVGTNAASKNFAAINAEAEKYYKDSSDILRENDMLACYTLSVQKNEKLVSDVSATVRIKFPENLSKKKSYSVIALYNNGDRDVLYATVTDGYITFNAADMGSFIIISPVEGLSLTTYVTVIGVGVIVVLLVIFFVALFRKKY